MFFHWHVRSGPTPDNVKLFGSWNGYEKAIDMEYNGTSMFGVTVDAIPTGAHYYYFQVNGETTVDYTKEVTTVQSEERNAVKVPLVTEAKGTF